MNFWWVEFIFEHHVILAESNQEAGSSWSIYYLLEDCK
jgi:hypothetical protein